MSFRRQLQDNPESVVAHVGLGKSLVKIGQCGEALEHLLPYVGRLPFGADAAMATAVCSRRLGWLEDALWFDEYAIDHDPLHARALSNYALDLDAWGDPVGADAVVERIEALPRDQSPALYVRAVLAIRRGQIDEFDFLTRDWEAAGRTERELRRLQAQTWLDLDDPVTAFEVLAETRSLHKSYAELALRAEAARRMGDAELALSLLDQRGKRPMEGGAISGQRALILTDLGDLAGARAELAEWEGVLDEDLCAARWYLARAEGRTADVARFAQDFLAERVSPLRTLEQWIPKG
jgi:thioredoxin-like negative regulator of GroEL